MQEFLNELYSYEYFGIYLVISIIVLVLLFVIILFLGKKDQIEREKTATLKLQQINNEAFKEESIIEKVEVPNSTQDKLENDTIIVPNISDMANTLDDVTDEIPEPVLPVQEEVTSESAETSISQNIELTNEISELKLPEQNLVTEEVVNKPSVDFPAMDVPMSTNVLQEDVHEEISEVTPLLSKVEEKPLVFNDFNVSEVQNTPVEEVTPVVESEELEVPTFNFDEIVRSVEETKKEQTYTKGPEIFSSVYVPKKEVEEVPKVEIPEPVVAPVNDLGFELPTLKKEAVEEATAPVVETPVPEEKEDKIEMPVLLDYDLDNLAGEIYNINK